MPHPDDTLAQLARLARDDDALHAASERRPLTPDSADQAPASALPESLTQPISDALQSSFVDAIQARLADPKRTSVPPPRAPLGRQRRDALIAFVGLTAAAAGVLLTLRGSSDTEKPLPRYEVRLEGSLQSDRGVTQTPLLLRLRSSSTLQLDLRPTGDVQGPVLARAFLQRLATEGAGELRVEVTQEQSPAGALRLTAQLPAVLSERGLLVLYVGRSSVIDRPLPKNESGHTLVPDGAQAFRWQFERAP
jgi:hypothetical protein